MRRPPLLGEESLRPFALRMVLLALIVIIGPPLARILAPRYIGILVLALVIAGLLVVFTIPDLVRREADYTSFSLGFLATVLAPGSITNEKFYELTTQIVPVLFLALAVETQAFRIGFTRTRPRVLTEIFLAVPALALVVAGFESFRVIVVGQATRGRFDVVVGSLVAAATSLTIAALVGHASPTRESRDESSDGSVD
jgi:hypothetical protein